MSGSFRCRRSYHHHRRCWRRCRCWRISNGTGLNRQKLLDVLESGVAFDHERIVVRREAGDRFQLRQIQVQSNTDGEQMNPGLLRQLRFGSRRRLIIRIPVRDNDADSGDVIPRAAGRPGKAPLTHVTQRIRRRRVITAVLPNVIDGVHHVRLRGVVVELELELRVVGVGDNADLRLVGSDAEQLGDLLDEAQLAPEVRSPDAVRRVHDEDDVRRMTAIAIWYSMPGISSIDQTECSHDG